MGRPPLPLGTAGKVTTLTLAGMPTARCKFHDYDGVVRLVQRSGPTETKAKNLLAEAIRDRQHRRGGDVGPDSRVSEVAKLWYADVAKSTKAVGTKQHYEYVMETYVLPAIGAIRVRESTVGTIDLALNAIVERHGKAAGRSARTVMSGIFGLATRRDALVHNPVRDTSTIAGKSERPRSLTRAEEDEIVDALRSMQRAVDLDLPDLAEWMLGTGCRIGEACAARDGISPSDRKPLLDLDAGTWEINATVIRVGGVRRRRALEAKAELTWQEQEELAALLRYEYEPGLHVQERTKTQAGWRRVALPPHLLAMHQRRAGELRLRAPGGIVFGSPKARALRDPSNTPGDLRQVLDAIGCETCNGTARVPGKNNLTRRCPDAGKYSWVTSHTFRKTTATRLEEAGCTPREVADQLGHARPSVTMDIYFGRDVVTAKAATILGR